MKLPSSGEIAGDSPLGPSLEGGVTAFRDLAQGLLKVALAAESVSDWLRKWSLAECKLVEQYLRVRVSTEALNTSSTSTVNHASFFEQLGQTGLVLREDFVRRSSDFALTSDLAELRKRFKADLRLQNPQALALETKIEALALRAENAFPTGLELRSKELVGASAAGNGASGPTHTTDTWDVLLLLVRARQQLAVMTGCKDYTEYNWREQYRFSYSPHDSINMAHYVLEAFAPLGAVLQDEENCLQTQEHPERSTYRSPEELFEDIMLNIEAVDERLARLLREGKEVVFEFVDAIQVPYALYFPNSQQSLVRLHFSGHHSDLRTGLHEAGHAIHNQLAKHLEPVWIQDATVEFSEVVARLFEFIPLLATFRGSVHHSSQQILPRASVANIIREVIWAAKVELFEHWLYSQEAGSLSEHVVQMRWKKLINTHVLDSELERYLPRRLPYHILSYPFYSFRYALAQIGAIRLVQSLQHDFFFSWDVFLQAMAAGGTPRAFSRFRSIGFELPLQPNDIYASARWLRCHLEPHRAH